MLAILNVGCTAIYQIWCGALQRSLGANPLQLQLYNAPMSAVGLLPFVPLLEDYRRSSPASIWAWTPTAGVVRLIALTGVLALCVNVNICLVIGSTTAVWYNVLSHAKTTRLYNVSRRVLFLRGSRYFRIKVATPTAVAALLICNGEARSHAYLMIAPAFG